MDLSSALTHQSTGDEGYDIFYRTFLPFRYIRLNMSRDRELVLASQRWIGANVINGENRTLLVAISDGYAQRYEAVRGRCNCTCTD